MSLRAVNQDWIAHHGRDEYFQDVYDEYSTDAPLDLTRQGSDDATFEVDAAKATYRGVVDKLALNTDQLFVHLLDEHMCPTKPTNYYTVPNAVHFDDSLNLTGYLAFFGNAERVGRVTFDREEALDIKAEFGTYGAVKQWCAEDWESQGNYPPAHVALVVSAAAGFG